MSTSLKTSALLVLAFVVATPTLAPAQVQQSRKRFLQWSYRDASSLAYDMTHGRTPLYALGVMAALTPLTTFDKGIDYKVGQYDGPVGSFLNLSNHLGGPEMNIPVVGVFAVSLLTDNEKFQDAAFTSLQAMVYAGVLSYGLKYSVGRFRPYEEFGAHRFAPFSGRNSFPSGHTTTAFAVLTPWVLYYPHPVTYGLFALGTGTAISRIVREKHWATDVLAGGALGFMTAYYLTRRHQGQSGRFSVTPVFSTNAASVSVRIKL